MSKKNDDGRESGEFKETAFYAVLPLLVVASLFRGCSARSAEIPDAMKQTTAAQQIVSDEAAGTRAADYKAEPEEETGSTKGPETVTVRSNPYNPANFSYLDEISENIAYFDENYESLQGIDVSDHQGLQGIDVSDHQGEIDWEAVADAGYEFVFVRVGFRGYGEGTLNEDSMAIQYMQGADAAGLEVGAYFFSQALDEEEAAEEALFAVDVIERSGVKMTLPLVYDPEFIEGTEGRADNLSREQISANAHAFKEAAEKAMKCKTALYTNLYWENNCFDNE